MRPEVGIRLSCLALILLLSSPLSAEPVTVELSAEPLRSRTVDLVEQWRAGGDDPDEILMGVIEDVEIGPGGDVYLLDRQLSRVLVYSAGGEFRRTLGRQGEGPGELNHPHGLAVFEDGRVAAIRGYPGRVTLINPDDTPGGQITLAEAPEEGGFDLLRELVICRDRIVCLRGHAAPDAAANVNRVSSALVVMDRDGGNRKAIVEHRREHDLEGRVFDEGEQFSELEVWAAGAGALYTVPSRDEYSIRVRAFDGEVRRILRRDFSPRRRTRQDRDRFAEGAAGGGEGQARRTENRMLDHDPAIAELAVAPDGRLFVRTCWDAPGLLEEGVAGRFDVITPDGRFAERLTLRVPGFDGGDDRLLFLDGERFAVIRNYHGASRAMMAMPGSGSADAAGDSDEEAEPIEVVIYGMR